MPEPMHTPMRSLVAGVVVEAGVVDRLHRRREAVVDERVEAPRFLRATGTCATSKPFTSPAICDGNVDASKRVIGAMPERPARMFAHAVGDADADGRDDAQAGDDDAAAGHGELNDAECAGAVQAARLPRPAPRLRGYFLMCVLT